MQFQLETKVFRTNKDEGRLEIHKARDMNSGYAVYVESYGVGPTCKAWFLTKSEQNNFWDDSFKPSKNALHKIIKSDEMMRELKRYVTKCLKRRKERRLKTAG